MSALVSELMPVGRKVPLYVGTGYNGELQEPYTLWLTSRREHYSDYQLWILSQSHRILFVHGDLRPHNIMVKDGQVIARILGFCKGFPYLALTQWLDGLPDADSWTLSCWIFHALVLDGETVNADGPFFKVSWSVTGYWRSNLCGWIHAVSIGRY